MRYIRRGPSASSLEKAYTNTMPLLTEPDLGVPIDLVNPSVYENGQDENGAPPTPSPLR